jgi:hypothetical protein
MGFKYDGTWLVFILFTYCGLFVVHSFEPSFGLTGLKSKNAIIFY